MQSRIIAHQGANVWPEVLVEFPKHGWSAVTEESESQRAVAGLRGI